MRKRMLFSLLVVFLMGISVFAAEVLPPSIMPVLVLSDSDYQMGYQYGQQAGQYIELQALATWASTLQKFSRDEVLAKLKASQYFTREYAPEVLEQMEGMVDGAIAAGYEVSFTDLLLINAQLGFGAIKTPWPAVTYPSDAEYEELPGEGGANWSAWGSTTRDGSLISGDVVDAAFCYQVVIVAFPERGNSYLAVMRAGQVGNVPAMNNKGLFGDIGRSKCRFSECYLVPVLKDLFISASFVIRGFDTCNGSSPRGRNKHRSCIPCLTASDK